MKSKEKNITSPQQQQQQQELMEQVYAIIDSKLQYIDYQTEMVTSSFVDFNSLSQTSSKTTLGDGIQVIESIMSNNDRILEKLQEFSATVKLLLFLRNELSPVNTTQILDLLTDNKYIQLTDQELKFFLDKKLKYSK